MGVTLFGASLDDNIEADGLGAVAHAFAAALGTTSSLVSIQSVEYVLQIVIATPGVDAASASRSKAAVGAALLSATGASSAGVSLNMLSVNMDASRRKLLGTVEFTAMAYSASLAAVLSMNTTLYSAVSDGSLTAALVTAGVNATGVELPVPTDAGAQFHVQVQCPDSAVGTDGTPRPSAAARLRRASAGALDASTQLLPDIAAVGLGVISHAAVTLSPILGAHSRVVYCLAVTRRMASTLLLTLVRK